MEQRDEKCPEDGQRRRGWFEEALSPDGAHGRQGQVGGGRENPPVREVPLVLQRRGQRRGKEGEQPLRPGEEVLVRTMVQRGGRVLEHDQELQIELEGVQQQPAPALERCVQGRRHQTVAGVEVGLPARSVVLVAPGQVPHRNTRQRHGREPVLRRPEAVLGVVPFDEQRKGEPLSLDGGPGDQAHPPAGVVDVHSPVQVGGLPQALPCEVVPVVGIGCRPPEEPVLGDHLAHRVEDGAVLQGQHLAAHEHRALGEAGEGEGTRDAVGLEEYVVVQQDVMRRVGLGEHLVHRPGETTAPAEVGLLDQV